MCLSSYSVLYRHRVSECENFLFSIDSILFSSCYTGHSEAASTRDLRDRLDFNSPRIPSHRTHSHRTPSQSDHGHTKTSMFDQAMVAEPSGRLPATAFLSMDEPKSLSTVHNPRRKIIANSLSVQALPLHRCRPITKRSFSHGMRQDVIRCTERQRRSGQTSPATRFAIQGQTGQFPDQVFRNRPHRSQSSFRKGQSPAKRMGNRASPSRTRST